MKVGKLLEPSSMKGRLKDYTFDEENLNGQSFIFQRHSYKRKCDTGETIADGMTFYMKDVFEPGCPEEKMTATKMIIFLKHFDAARTEMSLVGTTYMEPSDSCGCLFDAASAKTSHLRASSSSPPLTSIALLLEVEPSRLQPIGGRITLKKVWLPIIWKP